MILIKSFLTGVWYDSFKFIYMYLSNGEKVPERCSCLKAILQAQLHVGFSSFFLIKLASLKLFCLDIKLLKSSMIFKQKKSQSVLRLKILHDIFYKPLFKKCNCNSTHSCNRKIPVDITDSRETN